MKAQNDKFSIFVEDYNVPLAPWYIFNEDYFAKELPKLAGRGFTFDSLFYFEKNFVLWGANEKQFAKAGDFFSKRLTTDRKFVREICDNHYKCFKRVKKFGSVLKKLGEKTDKELYEIYERYYSIFADGFKWGMTIQIMEMGNIKFSEILKQELNDKLKKIGNPEVVFSKLISPTIETAVAKENKDIINKIYFIQQHKEILKEVKNINSFGLLSKKAKAIFVYLSKKYGWLQFYYLGPAAGPDYYFETIKKRININIAVELKNRVQELVALKKFQIEAEKSFNKEELFKLKTLKEFAYLKEARKEIHTYYLNFLMQKWHEEFARRFYFTPLQTKYIFKAEFKKILLNNKMVVNADILNERYDGCAYMLKGGKLFFYAGSKAKKIRKLFKSDSAGNVKADSFSGSVAYPGKAKGIVKIVNSTSDINKFNAGNVLVSYSTNPSLVPAMNKAAAIITNTGGVTCHAAIVARELKIPCVIGTKIATKILKDGDIVEVDADNGIITILKK
jgi:phosphohistidine swiveling domain-containing protein